MPQSMGDLHHWAWRPTDVSAAVYKESYAKRYKDWFPGECHAKECLQVGGPRVLAFWGLGVSNFWG